jgi:hypothetical protein
MIWTYLSPRDLKPELPVYEFLRVHGGEDYPELMPGTYIPRENKANDNLNDRASQCSTSPLGMYTPFGLNSFVSGGLFQAPRGASLCPSEPNSTRLDDLDSGDFAVRPQTCVWGA